MELDIGRKYLHLLFNHIFEILFVNKYGVNHVEHIFVRVLFLLSESIELKSWFLDLAKKNLISDETDLTMFNNRPEWFIDPDLIFFIAHATKWNEFKLMAEERKSILASITTLNDEHDFSELLFDALEDNWEDRDFYNYFVKVTPIT